MAFDRLRIFSFVFCHDADIFWTSRVDGVHIYMGELYIIFSFVLAAQTAC